MNVLVVGGAGYIGSHTVHQLIAARHNVTVLDNLYSGHRWAVPSNAQLVIGDIRDTELVERVLRENRINCVMHFAAHIIVPESVVDPLKYYSNNTAGFLALLQACQPTQIRQLIFSSTAAVYGDPTKTPVNELTPTCPINPYGSSKLMCEWMLQDYGRSAVSNFRYVIMRYFNVAGAQLSGQIGQATPNSTHLIKLAAQTALGLRPHLSIFGLDYPTEDGTCVRDYIHVDDMAAAHIDALNYLDAGGPSDVFNCGYGRGFSVRQVVDVMRSVSGTNFAIENGPRRPGDSASLIADAQKIRRVLGWRPKYEDLGLICRTALNWERSQMPQIAHAPPQELGPS